jgi:hypothetical protein
VGAGVELRSLIGECLELLDKIEGEQPDRVDLHQLHAGSGAYARLKQYRDTIAQLPYEVRCFCEYLKAARCPPEAMGRFLSRLLDWPEEFLAPEKESFAERRKRITALALGIGLDPLLLFRLIGLARIKGLLGTRDALKPALRGPIQAYLGA